MSWQYLTPAEEIADLQREKANAERAGAESAELVREIDARIAYLLNDDGNGGRER